MNQYLNLDCMDKERGLPSFPDNHFDLAIVDPPYGIGLGNEGWGERDKNIATKERKKGWDNEPPRNEYFEQLFRISDKQIIWGGNYFLDHLGKTDGFIVWDKMNGTNPMADAELAWKSMEGATRMFRMHHFSAGYESKIHPTQKPSRPIPLAPEQLRQAGNALTG
jgi:site-specific DNA-methyltransferase (adenine-specific)